MRGEDNPDGLIQGRRHHSKTVPGKEKDMSPPLAPAAMSPNQPNYELVLKATYDGSSHGKESATKRGDGK